MKLKVYSSDASKSSEKEFNVPTFEGNKGVQAVKEVVVAHRANARHRVHVSLTVRRTPRRSLTDRENNAH